MSADDLDELIETMSEAASALFCGNAHRYFALMNHADDFTLMGPTGGETSRGSDVTDEQMDEMERFFRGEAATLEVVETYSSGDLAVLVVVEHQRGEVGDYAAQDWSLRVTLVFRREGATWRLVHRHADPLVHEITFDQLAELARG
jgi:ketosteroid isomerase-like protein